MDQIQKTNTEINRKKDICRENDALELEWTEKRKTKIKTFAMSEKTFYFRLCEQTARNRQLSTDD